MAVASGSFPSDRVLPAIAAGALASMVVFAVLVAGEDIAVNGAKFSDYGASFLLFPGIAIWFGFLIAIATVGLPCWVVLHRLGWAKGWVAALLGGVEAAAVGAILVLLPLEGARSGSGLAMTGIFAVAGAIGGWTIWRVAYRRET